MEEVEFIFELLQNLSKFKFEFYSQIYFEFILSLPNYSFYYSYN